MRQRQKRPNWKTAYCGYLYADGHAVIIHQERHPKAGEIEYVEIFRKLDLHCAFDGRIVFHQCHTDRRFRLLWEAQSIRASTPSLQNGSENTKRREIAVSSFTMEFKDGSELYWVRMPDIISDQLTYQPEATEVFNPDWHEGGLWSGHRIVSVHGLPEPTPAAESEAA